MEYLTVSSLPKLSAARLTERKAFDSAMSTKQKSKKNEIAKVDTFLSVKNPRIGFEIKREQRAKPHDLLLAQKFVRRMKGSKFKIVNCQIFKTAINLGPY